MFREGRPEDFLSKNMPINYTKFDEDDEKVQIVREFLEQVFPDKSLRTYFLDTSSDVFVGGSLAKNTLIKKAKYDVDLFIRFEKRGQPHRTDKI